MENLKPCPTCGGEAELQSEQRQPCMNTIDAVKVECKDCGTQTKWFMDWINDGKEEAITQWNNRPMEDALQKHIDNFNSAVKRDLHNLSEGR